MNHILWMLSVVLNTAIGVAAWLVYDAGLVETAWQNDVTYITPVMWSIAGVTYLAVLVDTARVNTHSLEFYDFIASMMVSLGMAGTVYGFVVALSGVSPSAVSDTAMIGPMVGKLVEGMGIALWTTLSGIACYIVLSLNIRLLEWRS